MFCQQLCAGNVKDSDDTRVEATAENLLTGMKGHRAGVVLRVKIIQLHIKQQWKLVKCNGHTGQGNKLL